MRVLLTGGSGQVGSEFRKRADGLELLAPERAQFDLSAPDTVRAWLAAEQPDIILNVGAYTAVDRAEEESTLAHQINGQSVHLLAEYAIENDLPLIQLSTDYVFDGRKAGPYLENDQPSPQSVYGASKLVGEHAAIRAAKHLILRVSWVFAAQGANFVKTMLRLGAERDKLRVVDDQIGCPTWAGDIATNLRELVGRLGEGQDIRGIWHLGGNDPVSWCDFARTIFDEARDRNLVPQLPEVTGIASHQYPTAAARPANSVMDGRRAVAELGLTPHDWRAGLRQVLDDIGKTA